MEWDREHAANLAEAKKATFSKIFKNEKLRDEGMRQYYIDPTTYDSPPVATGFGDQSAPDVAASSAPAKDAAPAKEDKPVDKKAIQLEDNEAGLENQANGTPIDFTNVRGNPSSIEKTWSRGTTDMVDSDGKVSDIGREMKENPDVSRVAWKATRADSRTVAA